ncbi:prepilin-type N-terminal cleavage/methylation domain-containing protein [Rubrivivax sp. JA1024]|nr:prepilin-type N-terminal cleavage/methylation domain-containing protein [Rubrivivax sp. JA1024]
MLSRGPLRAGPPRRRQRGLSIVELMVGVTIGLLVVAASALLVSGQLTENRRLLLETQLQQDLRATADIVVRDLRRAGIWNEAQSSAVWSTENPDPQCNRYTTVTPGSGSVVYRYYRSGDNNSALGIRLDNGVLRSAIHAADAVSGSTCLQSATPANWQELTDGRSVKVTRFDVEWLDDGSTPEPLPCAKLCADGSTDCWPVLRVRLLKVTIEAESVADPSVRRALQATVKLRNDDIEFRDPAEPTRMCPA